MHHAQIHVRLRVAVKQVYRIQIVEYFLKKHGKRGPKVNVVYGQSQIFLCVLISEVRLQKWLLAQETVRA